MTVKKSKAGRKTVLTPVVREKILRALRRGNFRRAAAAYARIGTSTLDHWIMEGKRNPDSELGEFRRAVLEAEGDAEMESVRRIRFHAREDWKAAAFWLERKRPKTWGKKPPLTLQGDKDKPLFPPASVDEELLVMFQGIETELNRRAELAAQETVESPPVDAPAETTKEG